MPVVQPGSLNSSNKELGSIGVGSCVGHGQNTRSSVLEGKVFILEFGTVDGPSSSAIVVGEVTTLAHEVGNDTVEGGPLVSITLFSSAEGTEIFAGSLNYVRT